MAQAASSQRDFLPDVPLRSEEKLVRTLARLIDGISERTEALSGSMLAIDLADDPLTKARACRDDVFQRMQEVRALVDEAEGIVDARAWPFPGYGELLTTK